MRTFVLFFLFFIFFSASVCAAQDIYSFASPADNERFKLLTNEIRCVVCQSQSIADSNAPLANDLREKVYQMIVANKTDDEIKTWMEKRYGEFILLEPRFNKLTLLLWGFPLVGLLLILFLIRKLVK